MVDDRLSGGKLSESPTFTCSHCNAVVVMNPKRTRERAYCRGCNSYICDACGVVRALTFECRTLEQKIDQAITAAEKAAESPQILLL
jgi:hypothetical protein